MAAESRVAFYMDEHVPAVVSEALRRRGVDVLTAQAADMRGASDEQHLALAVRDGRAIFTQDVDFLHLHTSHRPHHGIIYTPQGTPLGTIVRGLILIYEVLRPDEMAGHVEFI